MNLTTSKKQYCLGDLVVAAYDQSSRATRRTDVASRLAIRKLSTWLAKSNRPDLLRPTARRGL